VGIFFAMRLTRHAGDAYEVLLYEDSLVVHGVRPWRTCACAELRYGPLRLAVDFR
jgi:hypothetical protein